MITETEFMEIKKELSSEYPKYAAILERCILWYNPIKSLAYRIYFNENEYIRITPMAVLSAPFEEKDLVKFRLLYHISQESALTDLKWRNRVALSNGWQP